jgi:hypothetical protein
LEQFAIIDDNIALKKKSIEIFVYPFCSELISGYLEQFATIDDNE